MTPNDSPNLNAAADPTPDLAPAGLSSGSDTTLASSAKSLLASRTFLGILVAVLPAILRLTGLELADRDVQGLAGDLVSILGSAIAIYGRITARQSIRLRAPRSESIDILLLLLALGAVLWLTGCASPNGQAAAGGTRWVESVSLKGNATREESTGDTSGSAEVTVRFRDARQRPEGKALVPLEGRPTPSARQPTARQAPDDSSASGFTL